MDTYSSYDNTKSIQFTPPSKKAKKQGGKRGNEIDTVFNKIMENNSTAGKEDLISHTSSIENVNSHPHHTKASSHIHEISQFNKVIARPPHHKLHDRNIHDSKSIASASGCPRHNHDHEGLIMEHTRQVQLINMLYLKYEKILVDKVSGTISPDNMDFILSKIQDDIRSKVQGYKQQDIKKFCNPSPSSSIKKLTKDQVAQQIICAHDTVELLVSKRLKCTYCKESCYIIYKSQYDKKQWTLDRIDNSIGHTAGNLVLSCLECNIKRGTMNKERFEKGKSIRIVRKLQF